MSFETAPARRTRHLARLARLPVAGLRAPAVLLLSVLAACGGGADAPSEAAGASGDGRLQRLALAVPAQARWSAPVDLGFVPAAAANVANGSGEGAGRVLLWSAENRFGFSAMGETSPGVPTWTALFDPATATATAPRTQAVGHNLFCPGTTNLPDGRLLVSGGSTSRVTSLYNPATDAWTQAGGTPMNLPRAYQANTLLRDGGVLTLGGSWNGGVGGKDGEVWTEGAGWRRLSGVPVAPFLTADSGGPYRSDNHMWLFPTGNGRVLHAGPSANLHWISTAGNGLVTPAGRRADDVDAMQGSAAMFEPGRILVTGGAREYVASPATASAFVIDARAELSVRRVPGMAFTRVFHNSVVLPSGEVLVIGGKDRSDAFNDDGARLVPELWNPRTETFTPLPPMSVPRTYHGVAILMPDARVLSAGSGLCGCAADQPRAQVLTPHYLLNDDGTPAVRPRITAAPTQAEFGAALNVSTDSPAASFVLIRLSSVTHTVANDQRRVPLTIRSASGNSYVLDAPSNPGIAVPGQYMLFALNGEGVPSLARTVRIGGGSVPLVDPMADLTSSVAIAATATIRSTGPLASSFSATGLPPGMAVNASTGAITGVPTAGGTYSVTVFAQNASGRTSTDFIWRVSGSGSGGGGLSARYLRLEQLSEVNGEPWASMAELEPLDGSFTPMSRAGFVASASSQESIGENGLAANALDGSPLTLWHSRWSAPIAAPPHWLTVDLGSVRGLGGLRYLPRQDGMPNGSFARFAVRLSSDGINWSAPVASGDFSTLGAPASVKEIRFAGAAPVNRPPVLVTPGSQSGTVGVPLSLQPAGSDPDGQPLSWSASGLPPGLGMAPATGLISGTPTTAGVRSVVISASDGQGGTASTASFSWTIAASSAPVIQPVAAPIALAGTAVSYTASATGTGLVYAWNFGDGSPTTAFTASASASRTYAAPGLYTVSLTVRASSGAQTTRVFTQAVGPPVAAGRASMSSTVAFEPRATGNARVWAVNPDNGTVAVLDAATNTRLAEIATGAGPASLALAPNGWVWVVNRDAATISIFQGGLSVAQTLALPPASQPHGIAFAPDGRAYVALDGPGELLRINADRSLGPRLPVGPHPRQVSVTADGARVLVSRFITPPLPGEGTATVDVSPTRGGQVVSVLTASFTVQGTAVLRHSERPDSSVQGRGIPNYLGAVALAPDGRSAWVPSKQDNIRRGSLRDGLALDFQNTVRAVSSRLDLTPAGPPLEDAAARVDHDNSSVASAAVHHPSGAYLFVALETSRQVAVVDPVGRRELLRIPVGRAPQGLAVSPNGQRLYVSNFMERTVSVVDLSRLVNFGEPVLPVLASVATVGAERLSAQVLNGKRLFHDALDPRLSRDSYMSCASCHRDGGHDGRVWDFSSLGEGLRNTAALQGRAGMAHGALHWSGNFDELQDFEAQIRALAGGTGLMADAALATGTRAQPLGLAKAGVSADLDALAAYVASLERVEPSPLRNADRSLTASAQAGRTLFQNLNCASCHAGATFARSSLPPVLTDVGTLKASSGSRLGQPLTGLDTPTLRDLWATAPYLHDGSAPTVEAAIRAHTAATVPNAVAIAALSTADLARLADYLRQIGSEESVAPAPPGTGTGDGRFRFVRLEQLTEVNGGPWGSMAEFSLLSPTGAVLPRTGWVASASSQELVGEPGAAANAVDGSTASLWHTQWSGATPRPPHSFVVDLGSPQSLGGLRYLPRQDGSTNGTIAQFRFYLSNDGVAWGSPVASGDFSALGAPAALKEVRFTVGPPPANRPPAVLTPAAQTGTVGVPASLALSASDPDGQPLSFSATGLPPGLVMSPTTGVISGAPLAPGGFSVQVTVADGFGGSATTAAFGWTVAAAPVSAGRSARWVRLEQITEVNGGPWASMADFQLLGPTGAPLPRAGWIASASSQEVVGEPGAAGNAIDASTTTLWHTQWSGTTPRPPHSFTVDLGSAQALGGLRYLPRQDGMTNGTIAQFRFYLSADGVNWGAPVVSGDFGALGSGAAVREVRLPGP